MSFPWVLLFLAIATLCSSVGYIILFFRIGELEDKFHKAQHAEALTRQQVSWDTNNRIRLLMEHMNLRFRKSPEKTEVVSTCEKGCE